MPPGQAAVFGCAGNCSVLPEGDPALGQVVGCQLRGHGVTPKNSDVILAHFPGDVEENFSPFSGITRDWVLGRRGGLGGADRNVLGLPR